MGYDAIEEKLVWTRHHFNILDMAVADYLDTKNTGFFVDRYDEAKTMAWGRFDSLNGLPTTHISHIFGDVIQSANSCLDYLVCELFGRYNDGEPSKVFHEFPIVDQHASFNEKIGKGALFGIPFEAVAVIESLQPYKGGADSVNSRLLSLRTLTNKHKHRKVRVAVLAASAAPSDPAAIFEKDGEVYAFAEALPRATHFKANIGPFPVKDGKVEVNGSFTAVIVLEESGFRDVYLPLLAGRFCDAVGEACERLKPFFAL
jgi:hypothetical protein